MNTLEKYPESRMVIRFQDCDAFGHLNNLNYISYFINAREDHLREYYDFDLYDHARTANHNWFVTRHEIAYLRPAKLGEQVVIETKLIDLTKSSLTVEGVMLDDMGKKIKAVQWTNFRYIDLANSRSAVYGADLLDLLNTLLIEDIENSDLDKRIVELKRGRPRAAS